MLFTAAADGRVLQWSLHRGLEQSEILLAKRVARESRGRFELCTKKGEEGGGDGGWKKKRVGYCFFT
jgi:hypothetical protein